MQATIKRGGNNVGNVRIIDFKGQYWLGLEFAEPTAEKGIKYTHVCYIPQTADVRDGFNAGSFTEADTLTFGTTDYLVIYREVFYGQATIPVDKLYLRRKAPTWPTNDV